MIARILGEGQYRFDERQLVRLNVLDADLQAAVDTGDEAGFTAQLSRLLAAVRELGRPVPDGELVRSDLILPGEGTRLAEVGAMLADDGLIPG
jgi:PspAA-like protein